MSSVDENTCAEQGRSIPEGWEETTLGEACVFQRGFDLPKKDRAKGKYPLMVSNGQDGTHKEYKVEAPGIVTGRSGSLGNVFLVKGDFWPLNTTLWIKDFKGNDVHFIYYFLKKFPFERYNSGSGVPTLNRNHIHPLPVVIPKNIEEQKAIANILTAFDDKIENLQAQNKTLEETAQTIFAAWFGKYQVGDELPDGWRVGKLGEAIEIFDSQRIPLSKAQREEKQGEYRYYGATSVMDYIDEFLFDGIYLLLAEDGSVIDDDGYPFLQYVWGQFWVNNHAHILKGKNGFSTEIIYLFCKKMKVASIVTGAVQLKINQKNLLGFELVIPLETILAELDKLIQPFFQKVRLNSDQIQTLKKTRDTLLPKLMSGQIRLNEFK